MRFNRRVKLKIKGIVWMYVIGEQKEEQIGFVERLEMTDGRVHGIDGVQCPTAGDQPIKSAQYAVRNTVCACERCSMTFGRCVAA